MKKWHQVNREQGGLLKWFLISIAILFALGYFGINLRNISQNDTNRDNVAFVTETSQKVWYQYLSTPFQYLWNDVFVDVLWAAFIDNMQRLRDGQPTVLNEAG
ncbi:MAG: hypothetical protein OEX08_02345 [Candidatus Nomurabacteria bacterium]|nr:hypothetical protein [Candidatus Nomurabacteria bacterium]